MAKSKHLVSQYLENISRGALERHQDTIHSFVRHRQGIYALYRKSKLYYVGLASNLRSRLEAHLRDRHGDSWDRFSVYLTIGDGHLRDLESLVLRIIKPTGNKQKGKFREAENIQRSFAKHVREHQRQELMDLMGAPQRHSEKRPRIENNGEPAQASLAPYIKGPMKLRARYKGATIRANVRKDGRIRFNKKLYNSTSKAAAAACSRVRCHGWTFWRYERAPGDWVLINELRK